MAQKEKVFGAMSRNPGTNVKEWGRDLTLQSCPFDLYIHTVAHTADTLITYTHR